MDIEDCEDEEDDEEDDEDDNYFSLRHVDLTAVGLGLVCEENTSDLILDLAEAQDDELYQHKRQKVDNDLAMDVCFDSDEDKDEDEDEDNDLLDENDPLLPQCLFPEGITYEVDADGDIIIERLPSGNTLVFNSDLFLSPPPPLRAQYTSCVGENGYIVYNSKYGNQYYDEDPVEEEYEDEEEPDYSSMPELLSDNSSDDEDDEIIT